MSDPITLDDPDNHCFGCSPHNDRGLQLSFHSVDESTVWSEYTAEEYLGGAPGVIHGGIQAALLDETLGFAIENRYPDVDPWIVTVDFKLRYRRPVPTCERIIIHARFLRSEGKDFYVEGEIVNESGEVLTKAEARWREIDKADEIDKAE